MAFAIFFVIHWYGSLFFQSFFNHRYAAHRMFTMSKGWEKVFYFFSWFFNGASYLSPRTYGILHRLHHAHADTEDDPHSPLYSPNLFSLMWKTRNIYVDIEEGKMEVDPKFLKNLPDWPLWEKFGESRFSRISWVLAYIGIYALIATQWWMWLFLPITLVIGPAHGVIINYFAHKFGYTNFKVSDTSKNFLPFDFLMWGESYHNNHHKFGSRANFGVRWFEIDPLYQFIRLFSWMGIIKMVGQTRDVNVEQIKLSRRDIRRLEKAYARNKMKWEGATQFPGDKLATWVREWEKLVNTDWKSANISLKDIEVRKELELFLRNTNANARQKLAEWIEPLDRAFQEKLENFEMPQAPDLKKLISSKNGELNWGLN